MTFDLVIPRGNARGVIVGPVTVENAPVDLTVANTQVRFTAKTSLALADDAATGVIRKTFGVTGGPGGITVNDPATTDKNKLTVTLAASDSTAFPAGENTRLEYDVELAEPSGRISTIARGTLTFSADVTRL